MFHYQQHGFNEFGNNKTIHAHSLLSARLGACWSALEHDTELVKFRDAIGNKQNENFPAGYLLRLLVSASFFHI